MFSQSRLFRSGLGGVLAAAMATPLMATAALAAINPEVMAAPPGPGPGSMCSVASVKGTYGFSAEGFTYPSSAVPPALQGTLGAVGTTTFDGAGNVTITPLASSFNGTLFPIPPENGTYTVNSDCMMTVQFPSGIMARGVLVNGNEEIYIVQTNTGTTVSGTAVLSEVEKGKGKGKGPKKLKCTAKDIAGQYGFLAEGYAGPPTYPVAPNTPLAGNGIVTYDKAGTFVVSQAVRSIGGVIDPMPMTYPGTFTVNASCTVQMNFVSGYTSTGTVVEGGEKILFLETDQGTTIRVKAARQE